MRVIALIILVSVFFISCKSSDSAISKDNDKDALVQNDTIRIENKELEYEIIIIENGFDTWFLTQNPIGFYSEGYLTNRNLFYVKEWNRRVLLPGLYSPNLYEQIIQYEFYIDYGKELNYKLFMYFEFFQEKYNQRL